LERERCRIVCGIHRDDRSTVIRAREDPILERQFGVRDARHERSECHTHVCGALRIRRGFHERVEHPIDADRLSYLRWKGITDFARGSAYVYDQRATTGVGDDLDVPHWRGGGS
jgi:hypothetical protein